MTGGRLAGKRVLLTQAEDYMGPASIEVFREQGAEVLADNSDLTRAGAVEDLVAGAGHIDILLANLAAPALSGTLAADIGDDPFQRLFEVMVYPLHRLCRALLPQMYERRAGKIVVYGSATGLRAMKGVAGYCAARSAQVGYVRAVGMEAAAHNVQVNLIAQNFVENPVYYPPAFQQTEQFRKMMKQVPAGRLASGREDALFALFLASNESDFFAGQAIPFSGGWVQ